MIIFWAHLHPLPLSLQIMCMLVFFHRLCMLQESNMSLIRLLYLEVITACSLKANYVAFMDSQCLSTIRPTV